MNYRWTITLCFFAFSACADNTPPSFDDDAEIDVREIEGSTATLNWPVAVDNEKVSEYTVEIDQTGETLVVQTNQATLSGLSELTDYDVVIRASDEAGNQSNTLTTSFRTRDQSGPSWPVGAKVTKIDSETEGEIAEENTSNQLKPKTELELQFPAASDPSGVAEYKIRSEGHETKTVRATDTPIKTTFNAAEASKIQIIAIDKVGNESVPLSLLSETSGSTVVVDGKKRTLHRPARLPNALAERKLLGRRIIKGEVLSPSEARKASRILRQRQKNHSAELRERAAATKKE